MKLLASKFALVLLLITALATTCIGQAIADDDLTATVVRQAGKVEVKLTGKKQWERSEPDLVLNSGDMIRTLKGGKVQLLFPGETIILIKENSLLDIKALSPDGGGKVKALTGDFLFNLKQALSPGSTFEVESPGALAVVRGTIWAEFISLDGELLLVAFEDDAELTAGGITQIVPAGFESTVPPGGTPTDPEPTSLTLADVESGFGIPDEIEAENLELELEAWLIELQRLENDVSRSHGEFLDYYEDDYVAGMTLIYRNIPGYRDALNMLSESILEMMAPDYVRGRGVKIDLRGESAVPSLLSLAEVIKIIEHIEDMLDEIEYYISQFLSNPDDTVDRLTGLLPEGDPSLGIRGGQIDSDGDGLSDALEITLGIDPNLNNDMDGFISLLAPQDGEVFSWPAEYAIEFAFEPLESDLVNNYRIWIESGGVEYSQPATSDQVTLTVESLLDPAQGNFAQLFADTNQVTLTWYVTGEVESTMVDLGGDKIPAQLVTQLIASRRGTFDLRLAEGGTALCRVAPATTTVRPDDLLRVELYVDSEAALQDVAIRLRFDPSILEFEAGHTGLFWTNSVLFFGDTAPGEVTISGRINRDMGFIQGSGVLCELEFRVRGQEGSVSPLDLLETTFTGPGETDISVLREDSLIEVLGAA